MQERDEVSKGSSPMTELYDYTGVNHYGSSATDGRSASVVVGSTRQRSLGGSADTVRTPSQTDAVGPRRRVGPSRCCRELVMRASRGQAERATWTWRSVAADLFGVDWIIFEGDSLLGVRLGCICVSHVAVNVVVIDSGAARTEPTLSTIIM